MVAVVAAAVAAAVVAPHCYGGLTKPGRARCAGAAAARYKYHSCSILHSVSEHTFLNNPTLHSHYSYTFVYYTEIDKNCPCLYFT